MKYLKVGNDNFRDVFKERDGVQLFREAEGVEVEVKETSNGDTKVEMTGADGSTLETKVEGADNIEITIPEPEGGVEKIEVEVTPLAEAEKKCIRYAEGEISAIEAMEAGIGGVIEDGQIKVGVVEALPEAKDAGKVPEGIVSYSDMMEEKITGLEDETGVGGSEDQPSND